MYTLYINILPNTLIRIYEELNVQIPSEVTKQIEKKSIMKKQLQRLTACYC